MIASVWLLLSSLFYSLQLHSGSFPKPLGRFDKEDRREFSLSPSEYPWEMENSVVLR